MANKDPYYAQEVAERNRKKQLKESRRDARKKRMAAKARADGETKAREIIGR